MTKLIYTLSVILITTGSITHAQTTADQQRYKEAQTALNEKKCDVAFNALSRVTIDGKDQPEYLRLMGEMHECKGNKEQAVFFYQKYQAVHPNDTTQLRINYLQTAVEKDNAHNYKEHKKKQISEAYSIWGLNSSMFTNSRNAVYRNTAQIAFTRGKPVLNDHAALEVNGLIGVSYRPNKKWYASAFGIADSDVLSINPGFTVSANISLLPYFYKTKKIWIAAGPEIGYYVANQGTSKYYQGPDTDNGLSLSCFQYGLRGKVYYRHMFSAFVALNKLTPNTAKMYDYSLGEYHNVTYSSTLFSFGIGIFTRFNDE